GPGRTENDGERHAASAVGRSGDLDGVAAVGGNQHPVGVVGAERRGRHVDRARSPSVISVPSVRAPSTWSASTLGRSTARDQPKMSTTGSTLRNENRSGRLTGAAKTSFMRGTK